MSMWIRLLKDKSLETNGVLKNYKRGDWIEVGRSTAFSWINQGLADRPDFSISSEFIDLSSGIVVTGTKNDKLISNIKQDIPGIDVIESDSKQMLFSENMIWSNAAKIKRENIGIGFKLLDNWQMAIPLHSYDVLACHLGTDKDRDYAKTVLHDLRVPVYNTDLMFVRRCSETTELFNQWQIEKQNISDERLAFQIAYYKTKVVLVALPVDWCV